MATVKDAWNLASWVDEDPEVGQPTTAEGQGRVEEDEGHAGGHGTRGADGGGAVGECGTDVRRRDGVLGVVPVFQAG